MTVPGCKCQQSGTAVAHLGGWLPHPAKDSCVCLQVFRKTGIGQLVLASPVYLFLCWVPISLTQGRQKGDLISLRYQNWQFSLFTFPPGDPLSMLQGHEALNIASVLLLLRSVLIELFAECAHVLLTKLFLHHRIQQWANSGSNKMISFSCQRLVSTLNFSGM